MNGTDVPLGLDLRYTLVAGSLVISSPEPGRDTGSYQCLAINRCGTIISRAANLKFGCECPRGGASLLMTCYHGNLTVSLQISMTSLRTAGVLRRPTRARGPSWPASRPPITQVA